MAARLAAVLAAPELLRRLGDAAREHVAREHDPERAAAAMAAACADLAATAPPERSPAAPPPPSSLTWGALRGSLRLDGAAAWAPGERRTVQLRLRNEGVARWLAADRGQGGLALRVEVLGPNADAVGGLHWLPLPHDLAPGEEHTFELTLRRPLGPVQLRAVPRLLGMADLPRFGGPYLEGEV